MDEDKIIIDASNCLGNILHRNSNQTINVLIQKDALALVERVMQIQINRRSQAQLEKQSGSKAIGKETLLSVMSFHVRIFILQI